MYFTSESIVKLSHQFRRYANDAAAAKHTSAKANISEKPAAKEAIAQWRHL